MTAYILTPKERAQRERLDRRLSGRPHPSTYDPNWLDDYSPPMLEERVVAVDPWDPENWCA